MVLVHGSDSAAFLLHCYNQLSLGSVGDFKVSRAIIQSLLTAITEFAKQDKPAFLKFVEQNVDSNLLVVYRLLRWF